MNASINQLRVPQMTAGEWIRRSRLARGESQKALARALGVSQRTVSAWEGEEARVGREHRIAALAHFGIRRRGWLLVMLMPDGVAS